MMKLVVFICVILVIVNGEFDLSNKEAEYKWT